MKVLVFGGLASVALGVCGFAAFRGGPVTSTGGAGAPQPLDAQPTTKWLKPCEKPCLGADGQELPRFEVIKFGGDCNPECFEVRQIEPGSPCTDPCFILVDAPDGATQFKVTLTNEARGDCNPGCFSSVEPCHPECK